MDISRPAVEKPRFIDVEKFVESRTNSVAQLLKAIDNDALVGGEVTKGPRTAAQRLPRHMRRRAMAYEVRRFPKGMRDFAASHIISNHRKKPPSRFARRKPSNILKSYNRRQMKNGKWLETHIWHAKRFRMIKRWGFKLADRSYQRGYRAIIRDSKKNCVIRDRSFMTCIVVHHASTITEVLDELGREETGWLFSTEFYVSESELPVHVFKAGKYPEGYIGPAQVLFPDEKTFDEFDGKAKRMIMWVHPSCEDEMIAELISLLELQPVVEDESSSGDDVEGESVKRFLSTKNDMIKMDVYHSTFSRFRLFGPLALRKLGDSIRLTDLEEYRNLHEHWRNLSTSKRATASFPLHDGILLALSIEDPRICRGREKTKLTTTSNIIEQSSYKQPASLWDPEVRKKLMEQRMTSAEFEKKNAELIGGVQTTDAKVPINVFIKNLNTTVLNGCEVVIPQQFGKDLWVALQRQGVRASGLRDDEAAHSEGMMMYFPNDDVDCAAGKAYEKMAKQEMEEKYNAKPHNRRCQFWSALSIKYPFDFHFEELLDDWSKEKIMDMVICRDMALLVKYCTSLLGLHKPSEFIEELADKLLIPVKLTFIGRGRPKRLGIICVPTEEDMAKIRKNRNVEIIQHPRASTSEEVPMEVDEEEKKKEFEFDAFVSLDPAAREKPISLKKLFELSDKLDDKTERRKKLNRKKKEAAKRRKTERVERMEKEDKEQAEKDQTQFRYSANREIAGRVMSGGYNSIAGQGIAIGYICANALAQISMNYAHKKTMVLVRNTTSKYYHPAFVSILFSMKLQHN